jgi:hypothetical protein
MQRDCNATCNALLSEDNELGSNFSECSAAAQNSVAVGEFSGQQMGRMNEEKTHLPTGEAGVPGTVPMVLAVDTRAARLN